MNNDDIIFRNFTILVIKIFIIINAKKLGWVVKIKKNQENYELILTKPSNRLTILDKNTTMLLTALTCNSLAIDKF